MRFDAVPLELLERCREGDVEAFEELCKAVQADVYAVLLFMLRNTEDAADAQQECLVRLYRHLGKLQDLSKFAGWFMRLLINHCNTVRKSTSIRQVSALDDLVEIPEQGLLAHSRPPPSPRAAAASREMDTHLNAAIATLPEKQRAAILMYEIEQMSVREISQVLECSEGVVKFNLHEARKKLQKLLAPMLQSEPLKDESHARL